MTDAEIACSEGPFEGLMAVRAQAECLFTGDAVRAAICAQAAAITRDYQAKNPVVMVVMNGGLVFAGQLLMHLNFPLVLDYCHATRYRGDTRGADITWLVHPQTDLGGRHILVVDDILDEGHTLQALFSAFEAAGAASVRSVVMVEKRHNRKAIQGMRPDYCGLRAPDRYLFGFGMDYQHYWRNCDGIYASVE